LIFQFFKNFDNINVPNIPLTSDIVAILASIHEHNVDVMLLQMGLQKMENWVQIDAA